MGLVAITFPFAIYGNQALIPVHQNGNALSVSAGSTLSYNTYEWFRGNTSITTITADSVFHPSQKGIYHVKVSNSFATGLTLRSDTIHYAPPDEFAESASASSSENALQHYNKTSMFLAYPNPARDILHVQTNGKATLFLTDQSGKILFTKNINGKEEINVTNLAAGLYYLRNNETGAVQKVVIAK